MKKSKNFALSTILHMGLILSIIIGLSYYIDPYFHYHDPQSGVRYTLNSQRYQNNGIVRNFEYDTLVTGTSMTENFKTSEGEELFGGSWVKTSLSGGSFAERTNLIAKAIESNDKLERVINSIDMFSSYWMNDADNIFPGTEAILPNYLYNEYIWDDVNYILNKEVLMGPIADGVIGAIKGDHTITSFDEYSRWNQHFTFGEQSVYESLNERIESSINFETEFEHIDNKYEAYENMLYINLISIALDNPQVEFYYFIPPYSIAQWAIDESTGYLSVKLEILENMLTELSKVDNIRVYAFDDEIELITNFDNYKDTNHYGEEINSYILKCMYDDKKLIDVENKDHYINTINEFFTNYDYESLIREAQSIDE